MLDIQRQRVGLLKEDVYFTRRILIAHLSVGVVIVVLLTAHGVMSWAVAASLWFLLTIMPMHGMMRAQACCRHLLGVLFLLFSALGVYFLTQVEPSLNEDQFSLVPAGLLPFWLGTLNILYAVAGACLIGNRKVRRATTIGFSLW